jgi:hypothetical protein
MHIAWDKAHEAHLLPFSLSAQNGRLSDAQGNLRAWEFERAFRDLLRRYTQARTSRRYAPCQPLGRKFTENGVGEN